MELKNIQIQNKLEQIALELNQDFIILEPKPERLNYSVLKEIYSDLIELNYLFSEGHLNRSDVVLRLKKASYYLKSIQQRTPLILRNLIVKLDLKTNQDNK